MHRLLLAFMLSLVATTAVAQPAKSGPATAAVQQADATIRKLLASNSPTASVAQAVKSIIDIDELGRRAMDRHWTNLKPPQQAQFLQLLNSLIQTSYVNAQQANLNYSIQYAGETPKPNGETVVHTKIQTQRKTRPTTIAIDYVMIKNGSTYKAVDVITAGVSLVDNYKAMFNKVITNGGFADLILKMQNKLQQLQAAAPAAAPTSGPAPTAPTPTTPTPVAPTPAPTKP